MIDINQPIHWQAVDWVFGGDTSKELEEPSRVLANRGIAIKLASVALKDVIRDQVTSEFIRRVWDAINPDGKALFVGAILHTMATNNPNSDTLAWTRWGAEYQFNLTIHRDEWVKDYEDINLQVDLSPFLRLVQLAGTGAFRQAVLLLTDNHVSEQHRLEVEHAAAVAAAGAGGGGPVGGGVAPPAAELTLSDEAAASLAGASRDAAELHEKAQRRAAMAAPAVQEAVKKLDRADPADVDRATADSREFFKPANYGAAASGVERETVDQKIATKILQEDCDFDQARKSAHKCVLIGELEGCVPAKDPIVDHAKRISRGLAVVLASYIREHAKNHNDQSKLVKAFKKYSIQVWDSNDKRIEQLNESKEWLSRSDIVLFLDSVLHMYEIIGNKIEDVKKLLMEDIQFFVDSGVKSVDDKFRLYIKVFFKEFNRLFSDPMGGWLTSAGVERPLMLPLLQHKELIHIPRDLNTRTRDAIKAIITARKRVAATGAVVSQEHSAQAAEQHRVLQKQLDAQGRKLQSVQSTMQQMTPNKRPKVSFADEEVDDSTATPIKGLSKRSGPSKVHPQITSAFWTEYMTKYKGKNRCVFSDIADVKGFEAWQERCSNYGAPDKKCTFNHKSDKTVREFMAALLEKHPTIPKAPA
jgi:hypothetical protein